MICLGNFGGLINPPSIEAELQDPSGVDIVLFGGLINPPSIEAPVDGPGGCDPGQLRGID